MFCRADEAEDPVERLVAVTCPDDLVSVLVFSEDVEDRRVAWASASCAEKVIAATTALIMVNLVKFLISQGF